MPAIELKRTTNFRLPMAILGASLAADESTLLTGCMDGVYLSSVEAGTSTRVAQHSSYVSGVAWLPDQSHYLSAGYDGQMQWFDTATNQATRQQQIHEFWSWDMAVSPDGRLIASVTGQYLAGGYRYEPQPEREPSVVVLDAASGEILWKLPHVPSVQAVCFSPDSRYVAAGNLMGEVRIWDCNDGSLRSSWSTDEFTSWGIIKSHCYLGGIFAMRFTPDGQHLLLAGMGPMHDPMAGNGKQLWQKWAWQQEQPDKVAQINKDDGGEGLMEALAIHPQKPIFAMGGRLRGGDWNAALFDLNSGERLATLKTGYRVTGLQFSADGNRLIVTGTEGQPKPSREGSWEPFGRVEFYELG